MVEHLVLFKLKAETGPEDKRRIVETLKELASIDGIVEFSAGLNHSREGKSQGFEIGMRIAFQDQAALDAYLPSQMHVATVDRIRTFLDDVIVVDYTH